jgi:hypothetical protein
MHMIMSQYLRLWFIHLDAICQATLTWYRQNPAIRLWMCRMGKIASFLCEINADDKVVCRYEARMGFGFSLEETCHSTSGPSAHA